MEDPTIPNQPTARAWILLFRDFTVSIILLGSLYFNVKQHYAHVEYLESRIEADRSAYLRVFDAYDKADNERSYLRDAARYRDYNGNAGTQRDRDTGILRNR